MAKCEYSRYQGGSDRCMIKASVKGVDTDKVNSETYREYCRYEDGYKRCPFYAAKKNESNTGCFVTSACVQARGLPDNCMELQILRAFRDGWLKAQPYGEESIAEYYRIAPGIVSNIDKRPDANDIYSAIYLQVILPCIEYIRENRNEAAFTLYRDATQKLAEHFT